MNSGKDLIDLKKMLDESLIILREYRQKLHDYVKKNQIPEKTSADILENLFEYLDQTIGILQTLMSHSKPFLKQSAILVRSIFEYSVRAAWASRVENGWMRYQAYWAQEDKKWVNAAKQDEELVESANRKFENLQNIIQQSEVEEELRKYPSMKFVLEEIWKKNIEEGYLAPDQKDYSSFIYYNVYRPLSRYVHGNVFIFQTPDEFYFRHISSTAAQAVFYICFAFIHTIIESPKNEIEALEKQIVSIFKGNQNESK